MRRGLVKKWIGLLLLTTMILGNFTGCAEQKEELTITGFAFDTTYTITLYQGGNQEILNSCIEKCSSYEKIFSRTLKTSELYQMNEIEKIYEEVLKMDIRIPFSKKERDRITALLEKRKSKENKIIYELSEDGSISFQISDMLRDIIEKGLEYSKVSEGKFDITVEPVTSLWNFKAERPAVPEEEALTKALKRVDYQKISLTENRLKIQEPGMGLDLGGIAKGFIADDLKAYLKEQGVTGATINLGGNLLCIGGKSEKEKFRIGIQQPFADRNETIAAVEVRDMSVVSSGIYERYFKTEDGTLYHHIIDPQTGYSYENDLLGVTIVSKKSVDGDALSTTCFALGKEEGIEYINSLEGVYALFITKDEKLWYSEGFQEFLIK